MAKKRKGIPWPYRLALQASPARVGAACERSVRQKANNTERDIQAGLPVLSIRRAETTVRAKDGETIVLGGLTLDQEP